MADLMIYLGNKNYSSWSLRPWLVLKRLTVEFDEVVIPLYQPTSRETVQKYSPSGRVPALHHGDVIVWESLAICEYLAESFPTYDLWPKDPAARALARAVSAEMHAGFRALREHLPMNIRSSFPGRGVTPEAQADINRIMSIWRDCRARCGEGQGDFLFGHFTIADAMYAPVVLRFETYAIEIGEVERHYTDSILALPALKEWLAAAEAEGQALPKYDAVA